MLQTWNNGSGENGIIDVWVGTASNAPMINKESPSFSKLTLLPSEPIPRLNPSRLYAPLLPEVSGIKWGGGVGREFATSLKVMLTSSDGRAAGKYFGPCRIVWLNSVFNVLKQPAKRASMNIHWSWENKNWLTCKAAAGRVWLWTLACWPLVELGHAFLY